MGGLLTTALTISKSMAVPLVYIPLNRNVVNRNSFNHAREVLRVVEELAVKGLQTLSINNRPPPPYRGIVCLFQVAVFY